MSQQPRIEKIYAVISNKGVVFTITATHWYYDYENMNWIIFVKADGHTVKVERDLGWEIVDCSEE